MICGEKHGMVCSQEEMKVYGYSLDNGNPLWTSDPMINPMNAYNRMGPTEATTAYGKRPNRKIIKKGKAFKKIIEVLADTLIRPNLRLQ